MDLTLLMPVYNEAATVAEAIDQVLATSFAPCELELIVVDDGSTDGTSELLHEAGKRDRVELVRHERNRGKGAAIASGLARASGTFTGIIDADLEYDPADANRLLAPLLDGEVSAVYGVRGFESHSAYSFWYVLGNKFVTQAANVLYNSWISDLMTCQKMLRTEVFRSLELRERGFAIEAEITARLLRAGVRIYEVPVSYRARDRAQGKKLTATDGMRVLRTLARCRIA